MLHGGPSGGGHLRSLRAAAPCSLKRLPWSVRSGRPEHQRSGSALRDVARRTYNRSSWAGSCREPLTLPTDSRVHAVLWVRRSIATASAPSSPSRGTLRHGPIRTPSPARAPPSPTPWPPTASHGRQEPTVQRGPRSLLGRGERRDKPPCNPHPPHHRTPPPPQAPRQPTASKRFDKLWTPNRRRVIRPATLTRPLSATRPVEALRTTLGELDGHPRPAERPARRSLGEHGELCPQRQAVHFLGHPAAGGAEHPASSGTTPTRAPGRWQAAGPTSSR